MGYKHVDSEFTTAELEYSIMAGKLEDCFAEYIAALRAVPEQKIMEGKAAEKLLEFVDFADCCIRGEMAELIEEVCIKLETVQAELTDGDISNLEEA